MQQSRQRMLVMHVRSRHYRAVCQSRLAIHTDVQLHAEVPLLALPRLMHFGVSRLVRILCGTGRTDDGGIHNRAGAYLQSAPLQYLADPGEQLLAELVALQQPAKLQQRRAIGNAFAPQVNPNESPQCGAVQQRFLAGFIRKVEPVLHKVHAQHALQTNWRATALPLRIVWLDNLAQLRPR
ncbi:hypothetical protein B0G80_1402 [Paraburkholderia sp. BL6669N2]|nr:hypothetical protein B0G80_1402 [Paraburkholderia sp. BL6669N2]